VKSIGSGFVADPSGIIVTNFHVIRGASSLQVKMKDGEIYDRVEVLDYDQRRDIAVLKIRAFKTLPSLPLSDKEIDTGEEAVAIGNPQGLEHTVSTGVISAFRQAEGYRLMQISVPISPGSYVRPLLASKSAPIPIADFTAKVGGAAPAAAASPRRSENSGRPPEFIGVWPVAHDHGDTFETFCLGKLYLTADVIGYTNDGKIHMWEVPLAAVREAAKNAVYGINKKAFHIRLTTGTNYNLIALNDQLQYLDPDNLLIAIATAKK
jgi:hypothetical protein